MRRSNAMGTSMIPRPPRPFLSLPAPPPASLAASTSLTAAPPRMCVRISSRALCLTVSTCSSGETPRSFLWRVLCRASSPTSGRCCHRCASKQAPPPPPKQEAAVPTLDLPIVITYLPKHQHISTTATTRRSIQRSGILKVWRAAEGRHARGSKPYPPHRSPRYWPPRTLLL